MEKLIENQWAIARNLQGRLHDLSVRSPESQGMLNCAMSLDYAMETLQKLKALQEEELAAVPVANNAVYTLDDDS